MAEPAKVIEFKIPKRRPKIVEKAALPDQRKFAVLPMAAVMDKELHGFTVKVLAVLCSYCNRAGLTWVGQQRIADHLGVAKQQVSRAMSQLRDRGHIQIVSKGFRGEKANTVRVIFGADISTEDAIALTSSQEDTRPPEVRKREAKAMTEPQEEFTEEQMAANRKRLKELLSGLSPKNHTTHQPVQIGAILMPKRAPRAPKKTPIIDNIEVVHEEASIDNIIDYSGVVRTQKTIGIHKVLSIYENIMKDRFSFVKTTETDVRFAEMLCQVGMDDQRFLDALNALKAPKSLANICADLIEG